jgi:dephospho-CoA kinase
VKVYGLTGGIASGKSTVRRTLEALGAPVIDADVIAREVVEPGTPGLKAVSNRFPGVLQADGTLDRAMLGARVFSDERERTALNTILHPLIAAAFREAKERHQQLGTRVLIYDAALLLENGIERNLDGVLLVALPVPLQKARLMARDGLSSAQVDARLAAQWPLERKLPLARWVVDNSGSEEETRVQVERVWQEMRADI